MSSIRCSHVVGRNFAYPDYRPRFPRQFNYSVRHLWARLNVDIHGRAIAGTVGLRLSKRSGDHVELDAVEMRIRSVFVDGRSAAFDYDGRRLSVAINGSGDVDLVIDYEARPRKGVYFILPDEYHRDRQPMVWTQGESEDNRYWIPLPDDPGVKFTSELTITVPRPLVAVSNGFLVERSEDGGLVSWKWRLDKPHSAYLLAFAVGDFEVIREECQGTPLEYYVPRGWGQRARFSFHRTCDMLRFFNEYTGTPYPWGIYKQVAVSEFIYGGMENTTVTILTDATLHDEHAHCPGTSFPCVGAEDFTSDPLVAHELAHQWFGDLVTTKDWANVWLNEAFATYMEALYTEHSQGRDAFLYELHQNMKTYLGEYNRRYSRPIVTRLYRDPEEVFDRHTYEKGSIVLHALRSLVGDEAFRRGVREFLRRFAHMAVDTEDLRKVMEEVSGVPLDWFFQQYVYSSGHPVIKYSWSYDAEGRMVKLSIAQTQGEDSYPWYRLDLELELGYPGGTESRRIGLEERESTIYLPVKDKPSYICLDPWFRFPRALDGEKPLEEAVVQSRSPSVICRIEAVEALGRNASRRAVEALQWVLENDPFWGVRAEAARALSKAPPDDAVPVLTKALGTEKHPRVRNAIVEALGSFRERRDVADTLVKVLRNDGESYYVRQRAAVSLGKLGIGEYEGELVKALGYPSHNHVITQGALQGLGELGTDGAVRILLDHTEPGKPTLVRAAATLSLGKFTSDRRVFDRINQLLRDPSFRVRYAAVASVESSMDPRFLDALDELSQADLDGRIRRYARDVARKIREQMSRGSEYAKLREEIEKLREDQRRILERLGRLEYK